MLGTVLVFPFILYINLTMIFRNLEEDKKHLEDVRPKFQALKVQVEQLKQSNEHYKEVGSTVRSLVKHIETYH